MTEKEIIYRIFLNLWDISKRYLFIPLDDFLWERLLEELEAKSQEYKQYGDVVWKLYRAFAAALTTYKESTRDK